MASAVKNGKAVLRRTGAYYGWTSPSGEAFEVYPVKNVCLPGQKWHAKGDRGTRIVRNDLAEVRADLPRCK